MWSTRGYFEKIFGDIWENLVKQGRHTLYSCRLITLLASLRDGGELNNSALDAIDKWIVSTSDDHREKVRACAFRAFANYTFGYFSEAVHDSEIALQRAEEEKDNNLAAGVKMNLAYFIAEEFYQNPSGHSRETDYARVKTLLSDAESVFTGNPARSKILAERLKSRLAKMKNRYATASPYAAPPALKSNSERTNDLPPTHSTACTSTELATDSSSGSKLQHNRPQNRK